MGPDSDWADRARTFLKRQLSKREVTYVELARRLRRYGFEETEASITNKLKRGNFTAKFLLASLEAIGVRDVRLDDI